MALPLDNFNINLVSPFLVAPVTSWLLYDSIYTERYMALPSDNSKGYNHSAIEG